MVAEDRHDRHADAVQLVHQDRGLFRLAGPREIAGQQQDIGARAGFGQAGPQPATRVLADVDVTDGRDPHRRPGGGHSRSGSELPAALHAGGEVGDDGGLREDLLRDGDGGLAPLRRDELSSEDHPVTLDADLEGLLEHAGVVRQRLLQPGQPVLDGLAHEVGSAQLAETNSWRWLIAEAGTGTSTESA